MRDKEKLSLAFREIAWMAIRYANGRQTYAPETVRMAISLYQEVYPDWEPKFDKTLLHDKTRALVNELRVSDIPEYRRRDWLDDLMADPKEADK